MIKFFRNIRKKLLNEGKTANYLKYAIGEILLVVIGILIALQVNNWNENRKASKEENKMLHQLKSDLLESKHELGKSIEANLITITLYNRLESAIQNKEAYTPVLDSAFGSIPVWAAPYFTTSAYETLKSKGLGMITDEPLRTAITKFYNTNVLSLNSDWNEWEWSINREVSLPWFSKNCRFYGRVTAKPNNYSELVNNNEELLNILSLLRRSRNYGIGKCESLKDNIDRLTEQIDKQLDNRPFKQKSK